MQRREFLKMIAAGAFAAQAKSKAGFTFAHITDTHIQPERNAAEGCRRCFAQVSLHRPDFAIMGGDLVFDVNRSSALRADRLFNLYEETLKYLDLPTYPLIGNHDLYGLARGSRTDLDAFYGKRMFQERMGPLYRFFDHKGWRFILLDSIDPRADPRWGYRGLVDDEQLDWLRSTLAEAGPQRPIIVVSHIPLLTSFSAIAALTGRPRDTVAVQNAEEVMRLFSGFKVKAVLQGHTHIREILEYRGCRYISSGAVCGNWWKGPRLGTPEGYALLRVRGEEIDWAYHTYDFHAADVGGKA